MDQYIAMVEMLQYDQHTISWGVVVMKLGEECMMATGDSGYYFVRYFPVCCATSRAVAEAVAWKKLPDIQAHGDEWLDVESSDRAV